MKVDKPILEEAYGSVFIESRNLETGLMMLRSPEEHVQIKASAALFSYVKICNEHKKLVIDKQGLTHLFSLLTSNNKIVKRNAIMVIEQLSEMFVNRKFIQDLSNIEIITLKLINLEEFDTTIEFGLRFLKNMCNDFIFAAKVVKRGGIKIFSEFINSNDPDIQKNAIEVLEILLKDFDARRQLKEHNIIPSLIICVKSEYSAIQKLALDAIAKAVLDKGNRDILKEMDVLPELLNLLTRPELHDIHISTLNVISNVFEDFECVQQLNFNGTLANILRFLGDQPHENQAKLEIKDSSDISKRKPSRKETKKKKVVEEAEKVIDPSEVFMRPETKIYACDILKKGAQIESVRQIMHEAGAEKALVNLLTHEDAGVRSAAADAICLFAQSNSAQCTITSAGGLEKLTRLFRSDNPHLQASSVAALGQMTRLNPTNCNEIAGMGTTMEILVSCLNGSEYDALNTLFLLSNLAEHEFGRQKLFQVGLVGSLVKILTSESPRVVIKAAALIVKVLVDPVKQNDFVVAGGLPPLVKMLSSRYPQIRRAAYTTIGAISDNKKISSALYELGALDILIKINSSENQRSGLSAMAMNRIFDANLILKFAFTGFLDYNDITGDVFYDVGPRRVFDKVHSLQIYVDEGLNDRRPIFLFNTRTGSNLNRSERIIQEIPIIIASNKEEGRAENHEDSFYEPPRDSRMAIFLKIVSEEIETLGGMQEQAEALGLNVATWFGGALSRQKALNCGVDKQIADYRCQRNTNIVPVGELTRGTYLQRALLFKFLADKAGLPCTAVRGEYGIAYNTVMIQGEHSKSDEFVVDLMYMPGTLIPIDSKPGVNYRRL